MDKYIIFTPEMKIANIVLWNGDLSTWQPPENCKAVLESEIDVTQYSWAQETQTNG